MNVGCAPVREIAAELALGIADGEERARALEHLATCEECRILLERLAATADELNLLAPSAEPAPGFESRATAAMARPPSGRPTLRRRLLAPAAAALAAAALGGAAIWIAFDDDRDLADAYREVLAVADGEYFEAVSLELPGGEQAGYVYGYEGRASWVFAVVYEGVEPGEYRLEIVDQRGEKFIATRLVIGADGDGSAGSVIPIAHDRVAAIRLLDEHGREVADSRLD